MILNGGNLHHYILAFCEPIEWINTLSLVSKTWNKACKSNALWCIVMNNILKELPSLEKRLDRKNLYESFKKIYSEDSSFILHDLPLCYEMSILNVDKYIRHTVDVRLFTKAEFNSVLIQYNSRQPPLSSQTMITTVKNTEWFLEPMRQLIKYLHIKHDHRLILWGNTMMSILLLKEISQKRTKKRIKREG